MLIASSVQRPASSVQRPASSVQRPASSVQRPASSVQRPASSVQRNDSGVPSQTGRPEQDYPSNLLTCPARLNYSPAKLSPKCHSDPALAGEESRFYTHSINHKSQRACFITDKRSTLSFPRRRESRQNTGILDSCWSLPRLSACIAQAGGHAQAGWIPAYAGMTSLPAASLWQAGGAGMTQKKVMKQALNLSMAVGGTTYCQL